MKNKFEQISHSDKVFVLATLVSVSLMVVSGILLGLVKRMIDIDFIVILIGILSSQVYRRLAKGYTLRIAIASLLCAFIGLFVVEIVTNFGVEGLLNIRNYQYLYDFFIQEDLHNVSWSVFRLISLVIAYSYARVV